MNETRIRIKCLGVQTVCFGITGSPDRIVEMVRAIPHRLDGPLSLEQFMPNETDSERWRTRDGIAGWPEGDVQLELFAVCFGQTLTNWSTMLEATSSIPPEFRRAGLPHLATFFSVRALADLRRQGILFLETTDEDSLWRKEHYGLNSLRLDCRSGPRPLNANSIHACRCADHWFLFAIDS